MQNKTNNEKSTRDINYTLQQAFFINKIYIYAWDKITQSYECYIQHLKLKRRRHIFKTALCIFNYLKSILISHSGNKNKFAHFHA